MNFVSQILLAASLVVLTGCSGSGLQYSNTPTSNMQFVSCGAYAERGKSVEFKCLVRFMNLSNKDYRVTAVFSSTQDEYLPKTVVKEFRGPIPSLEIEVDGFEKLYTSGIHQVKVNLTPLKNPRKVISHFDKSFLFTRIDSKMAKSMNLETEVIGESNNSAVGRLPGR